MKTDAVMRNFYQWCKSPSSAFSKKCSTTTPIFRLDALAKAWSIIATAMWLGGWLGGWVSVTAGIVSKRLKLSENFLDHLVGPSFKHLENPLRRYQIPRGTPSSGALNTWGVGKLAIFDVHRRLSRKRCEIGRWLLWNVNRKSWVPDWMV